MKAKLTLLVIVLSVYSQVISGQCPSKDSILSITGRIQNRGIDLKPILSELLTYTKEFDKCKSRDDSLFAKLLRTTGVVYYRLGEYPQAIEVTQRSIGSARRIASNSQREDYLLSAYANLSYYHDAMGQIRLMAEAIDSCMAIERRINSDYYYTCSLIWKKVQYLLFKGDYPECIRYGEMGQAYNARYATLIKATRPYYDSITTDFLSFTYRIDGLIFLKDSQQAEKLVWQKLHYFRKVNYTYNIGVLYNLFGHVYDLKGDYGTARNYYIQSCNENLKVEFYKGYIESMGKLGFIYNQRINKPDSALWYCNKALKYCDKVDSIYILNLIANAYTKKRNFGPAFQHYKLAYEKLGLGTSLSGELAGRLNDELSQQVIEYIAGLLMDYGGAKLQEYKSMGNRKSIEESIEILTITDHVLSSIKTDYLEKDTKLFWRGHSRRLYEFAIEACYLSDQKQKAFYFLEKSRAVLLNELLNDQRWLNNDQIVEQTKMRELIDQQEKQLQKVDRSSPEFLKLQSDLVNNREKLQNLTQRLREENPLYYQSYLDTAMVGISTVQNTILKDKDALVELFVGDSSVYLMLINHKNTYFKQINKVRYDELLEKLKPGFSTSLKTMAAVENFNQKSFELYSLLFDKVELGIGRVIISPDSQIFPFEALVVNSSSSPKYFLQDYSVSYTYSARYLLNTFSSITNSARSLLGFAPVQFSNSKNSLSELRGSELSLEQLQPYFQETDQYVGVNATKNNFLQKFPDYGIVQLYTHASAAGETGEPVIYFADSILYLSELVPEKKPSTKLIILSACETGKGKVYEGEGTFSFNRAFAAIGIPAAVTTLWSVESESTYQITELFYKYLSEGHPTDIALQKAKLEFLKTASKEKSLPYFWAGPILSGKSEKIEFAKSNPWKWGGLAIGLLLVITFIYWLRRGK